MCATGTQTSLRRTTRAFTLIEVLVVIAITALLIGLLLPSLSSARERGRTVACAAHLRQLAAANEMYVSDHRGHYAPGAIAIVLHNRHRWHGTRESVGVPFVPEGGSLTRYISGAGASRSVRACPAFTDILDSPDAFERGCGGYGYNNVFVGTHRSRIGPEHWRVVSDERGSPAHLFRLPAHTAGFADSAFAASSVIEYSFLEPRFHAEHPQARHDPSTHFRHLGQANVVWLDGHVSGEARQFTWSSGLYPLEPGPVGIGWFGESDDNSLFAPDL